MKKIIFSILLITMCIFISGCGKSTLDVALSGNSIAVHYNEDGVVQIINDEMDVKKVQKLFSSEYKETPSFSEKKADYIFYFGNDLNASANNIDSLENENQKIFVIDEKAYIIDGDKKYKSKEKIDLSILDKYHQPIK